MADDARIGIDAGRHVDGDDRHRPDGRGHVDFRYDGCYRLAQAAVKARSDHGIDDDGRGVEPFSQELPIGLTFRRRKEETRFVICQLP